MPTVVAGSTNNGAQGVDSFREQLIRDRGEGDFGVGKVASEEVSPETVEIALKISKATDVELNREWNTIDALVNLGVYPKGFGIRAKENRLNDEERGDLTEVEGHYKTMQLLDELGLLEEATQEEIFEILRGSDE